MCSPSLMLDVEDRVTTPKVSIFRGLLPWASLLEPCLKESLLLSEIEGFDRATQLAMMLVVGQMVGGHVESRTTLIVGHAICPGLFSASLDILSMNLQRTAVETCVCGAFEIVTGSVHRKILVY
jgi:hypothetical protein